MLSLVPRAALMLRVLVDAGEDGENFFYVPGTPPV